MSKRTNADKIVRTVCAPNCTNSCGINAHVKDGKIVKVEPADFPDRRYRRICLKGISNAIQRVYHPDRIKSPLKRKGKRGEDSWEEISWDEAFDLLTNKLTEIGTEYGPEANSWISMTGDYDIMALMLSERVANCLGGTVFTNLGVMGDLGANMGFLPTLGVHQEAHDYAEMKGSDFILMFGCNFAETALNDVHFLFDAMENGSRVVVVDPRFSRTAAKAHQWIPIRPGTDAAMILAMIHTVVHEKMCDRDFIRKNTNGPYLVRSDTKQLLRHKDLEVDGTDEFIVWDSRSDTVNKSGSILNPYLSGEFTVTLKDEKVIKCQTCFEAVVNACRPYSPEQAEKICEVPAKTIRDLD